MSNLGGFGRTRRRRTGCAVSQKCALYHLPPRTSHYYPTFSPSQWSKTTIPIRPCPHKARNWSQYEWSPSPLPRTFPGTMTRHPSPTLQVAPTYRPSTSDSIAHSLFFLFRDSFLLEGQFRLHDRTISAFNARRHSPLILFNNSRASTFDGRIMDLPISHLKIFAPLRIRARQQATVQIGGNGTGERGNFVTRQLF